VEQKLIQKIYNDALLGLQNGVSELQRELTDVDIGIEQLRQQRSDHPLIAYSLPEREKLLAQIDTINRQINRIRKLSAAGGIESEADKKDDGLKLRPDLFTSITNIPELIRLYLTLIGGGPVKVDTMIDDLNKGGAKVYSRRPRKGEDRSKPRPLVHSDITKLFSDYRSGYSTERQKSTSPFQYSPSVNELRLLTPEERQKEQEKPRLPLPPLNEMLKATLDHMTESKTAKEREAEEREAKRKAKKLA
jgi:hypothetical protein